MSKANSLVRQFLASKKKKEEGKQEQAVMPHNSFRAMFDPHELDAEELSSLKEIFESNLSDGVSEGAEKDYSELIRLTSELKAIQKQAVLLVGERIHVAREIFQKYGGSETIAFTSWLSLAFTSRKTAYNALAYYDLYQALPNNELKVKMREMPVKAGYVLASRKGEDTLKHSIIEHYNGEKQEEMLMIIEEQIPIEGDKRSPRSLGKKALDELEKSVRMVTRRKKHLSTYERDRIADLIEALQNLVVHETIEV